MADTVSPGRFDIVVFENRGWECIGRQDSYPLTPEEAYRTEIEKYVRSLAVPEGRHTMRYEVKGGDLVAVWTPYAGK